MDASTQIAIFVNDMRNFGQFAISDNNQTATSFRNCLKSGADGVYMSLSKTFVPQNSEKYLSQKFQILAKKGVLMMILLLSVIFVQAATKTWVPTAGGVWTTAANWNPSGQPATNDDVIINSNQSANITAVPTLTLASLTVSGNCSLVGSSNPSLITITGTFSVSASITLNLGNSTNGTRVNVTLSNTCSGTIAGTVNLRSANTNMVFTNSGSLSISSTGLIDDPGGNANSNFTLNSGATLGIGSTAGIASGTTASGNIQVTGTRSYSAGANYVYEGTANQNTGTGIPAALTGHLTINNTGSAGNNTVTLSSAESTGNLGTIDIIAGIFAAGTNLTLGSTSTINRSGGSMTGTPAGTGVYDVIYTGNSMTTTTELAGSGLRNITVNLTANQTLTLDQNRAPDGNLSITTGTFDLSTFTMNRSAAGGTLTIAGTMLLGGTTGGQTGSNFPTNFSTLTMTGGTVSYDAAGGGQTIYATPTYNNLTLNNSSGASLGGAVGLSNTLTLTSGILTTSAANLLSVSNTSTTAISGGSATSFINGPVKWTLPASLVSGSTYNFPVGKGTTYLPFSLVNPTTGTGAVTAQPEAFTANTGGTYDGTLASISTSEYWSLVTAGNFTNSSVSLTRQTAIAPLDAIGGSASLTGSYTYLAGTAGTNSVTGSNAIGTNRFFVLAGKKQTISTGTISGSPFCAGAAVSIPFTIAGTFIPGNVFTAQLSDATGGFTSPVAIGSLTQTTAGTISGTIPSNTVAGTGYRIRVVSNTPAITGSNNGVNLAIDATPVSPALSSASPASSSVICVGYNSGTATFTGGSGSGSNEYQYSIDGGTTWSTYTNSAAITTTAGTTSVQVRARRNGGACAASAYNTYTIWTYGSTPTAPIPGVASPVNGSIICAGFNTGTVTGTGGSGGSTGAANEYQVSINGGSTYSAYTNGAAITTTGATTSVIVQARRTGGAYGCSNSAWSTICTWIVSPATVGGTVASDQTICSGTSPADLTLSGNTGTVVKWQKSSDLAFTSPTDIAGTTTTLSGATIGNLSVNTYFRAVVQSGVCSSANSASVLITVNPATTISSQSTGTQAQCIGGTFTSISVTATGVGLTYQWYSNTSASTSGGTSLGAANGAQTNSYTPQATSAGTLYYYCIVHGGCGSDITSSISGAFIVNPVIANNTVSGAQSICTGTTPAGLTGTLPTGGSGSYVYLWESSTTSAVAGFATASGTSNTQNYAPGSLTQTTWYRRTVTSGGCSNTATAIQITVNPVIANNTVSTAQSICTGTTPAGLTGTLPTGGNGSYVYLWESSTTSAVAGFATASGTSNTQNYTPGSLTQTTWYRRTVTSGGCSNIATAIQITVNPVIANNTVSAAQSICPGTTPAGLAGTLPTGGSGSYVYLWESSTTSAVAGFATASGTSNTQNYAPGSLTQTTWYRRTVTSGGCSNTATAIQITVSPVIANNTVSTAQSICTGTTPAGLTGTLPTGGSGSYVYLWESSTTSAVAGFATASGTSNTQNYTPGSLTQTTWYRRTVTSGGCSNTATAIQITVNPVIANNTVSTAQSICTGTTPAGLTGTLPTGGSGSYVYLWESSTTSAVAGFATASGTSNTQNYSPGSLTQTTWYRRTVTSGGCSNIATAIQITVNPVIANNTVSAAQSICPGTTPAGLTGTLPTGGSGSYVYLWENSTTSAVAGFATASGTSNTQNYTPGSLTQTTWYRRTVTSGGCSNTATAIQITVNPLPTDTYTLTASPASILSGSTSTLSLSGSQAGGNYTYQLRTGTTPVGSSVTGTGAAISFAAVSPVSTTTYNVLATNTTTGCSVQEASTATVTVNAAPAGSIAVNRIYPKNTYTPAQLVQNVLVQGCLTSSNITFTGAASQIGHFTSGTSSFPIPEGIILSTGNVADAEGPNKDFGTTTQFGGAGDADINAISGGTSYDAAVLEFDFVPTGNTIQFNYVFASEEYAEFVGELYNDAFAFLLSGPGITGTENLALIPSTSTAVSINTVHGQGNTYVTNYPTELLALVASNPSAFGPPWTRIYDDATGYFGTTPNRYYYRITPVNSTRAPLNASYYVDNGQFKDRDIIGPNGRRQIQYLNQSGQSGSSEMEFDGRTTVLTATHAVTSCQTYHIKIVVADVNDQKWDSGVLLQAKSFTSNEVEISSHIGAISGDADNMYEGCEGSFIRFQRATGADNSQPFTFPVEIAGTAINGADFIYTDAGGTIIGDGTFPNSATLGAGVDYVDYYYKAQSDGFIEGNETIIFRVNNSCPCDPTPTYLEKTVTIIDVPQIQASTVSVIQCVSAGNPVATITVNMQGGLNPNDYQFSLDGMAFQASNVFTINSGQPDGSDIVGTSHYITVKDQYSCNSITEYNIIIPAIAPFNANAGPDINMCEGQSGRQLSASGGMFYTWTSSPSVGTTYLSSTTISNPTVSNTIPAGTYTFTVTAQNQLGASPACTGTDNMVLTVNQKPSVAVTADYSVACSGTAIHLNAAVTNGGASPSYFWNPTTDLNSSIIGNPVYSPVVTSFLAQFFTVTVTGSNGCSVSASAPSIEVIPPPQITTESTVNAACGASNGSATVSASSPGVTPVPPYTYLWDVAAGSQTTATATNLPAGTYTVTVTDVNHGCSNTKQVTVGSTADTTPPAAVCQNISVTLDGTGNATITPDDIDNGSSDNCTPSASLVLSLDNSTFNTSNIGDNTVTLTVKDLANNTSTCSATVHVNYSATCGAGGSRTIYNECFGTGTVNGGYSAPNPPYTISSGSRMRVTRNQNTANFFLSNTKTISSYTNLNISVDVPAQNALDAGYGADYIQLWYSVDGGAYVQFVNNGYMTGSWTGTSCTHVPDGTSVRIKILCMQSSSNEWREFDNVHLTGDPAMEATAAITNVTCNGGNNGAINVTVTKGVSPYTYAWTTSNGSGLVATAEDQTGLTAGTYNLVVTDANLVASDPFVFTVTQPAADPAIIQKAVSDATVCNPAGGNVVFTVTGSQSGVTYELKTTGGASLSPVVTAVGTGSNLDLTLLQANVPVTSTTYKVVATSASGCSTLDMTDQAVLTVNTTPAPTGAASQSFCSSGSPQISNISASGTGIIWYSAASGGSILAGTTFLVDGTTYYASQTLNGCESPTRLAVTVTVIATPTILSVTHGVICGSGTAVIYATASIGTINWYAAQTGGSPIGTGNNFTTPNISTTTSYWVDATNISCTTSTRSQVIATVYPTPTITLGSSPAVCIGTLSAYLSYSAVSGGSNQYSITFDGTALSAGFVNVTYTTLPASPITITVPGAAAGTYNAVLTVKNSSNSCVSSNYPITITITAPPVATFSYTGSPYCNSSANPTPTFSGGGVAGAFSSTTGLVFTSTSTGQINLASSTPGTYTVTNTIAPAGGCGGTSATSSVTITQIPAASINYTGNPFCTNLGTASVTRTGTAGGVYSSTAGLTIDPSTGAVTTTSSTPGNYTVTYTIAAGSGCGIVTATTPVSIKLEGSWNGSVSTDWNTAGNWDCNQLPTLLTNVLIANSKPRYPNNSTGTTDQSKDLTIQVNASVTVTGNTLEIAGAISNSGTFTATAGTIEMKGSGAQTIPASTFTGNTIMNLNINNSSGVTLGGPLNITGIVRPILGTLSSGGNLMLVSSGSNTALIAGIGDGSTSGVSGNVKMQRYLSSAFGYKYFSSPFSDATAGQFSSYLSSTATIPKFYRYDENHTNLGVDMTGWTPYSSGTLNPMEGYTANLGLSGTATPVTVELNGSVNNGNFSTALYNHNRAYTQGFNLVGNPYPSPIDWDAVSGWTKTNIDNAIYFFNATAGTDEYAGVYSSYVNGTGTGGSANLIPSMQGFFVHVTGSSGVFGMTNNVRTTHLNPTTFKSGLIDTRPILRFTAGFNEKNSIADPFVLYFDPVSTPNFDVNADALKLMNTDLAVPNLYAITPDVRQVSISGMPFPTDSLTRIPLGVKTLRDGWVNFTTKEIALLPSSMDIYLNDAELKINQDLKKFPTYRFYLKAGEYNQRFMLLFAKTNGTVTPTLSDKLFAITRIDGTVMVKINLPDNEPGKLYVSNMLGQIILEKEVTHLQTVDISTGVKSGVYVVTMTVGIRTQSEKTLIRKD